MKRKSLLTGILLRLTRVKFLNAASFIYLLKLLIALAATAQAEEGFINVQDGKLFYQKEGTGSPLIFLHDVCLDHRMWQQQVAFFSASFTCINIDLRGFGKSSLPATEYSFHEDINAVLDSLHIHEPVALIAFSMGGKAAINFSIAYPNKTKTLVLADAAVDGYKFKEFRLQPIYETGKLKGTDSANIYS